MNRARGVGVLSVFSMSTSSDDEDSWYDAVDVVYLITDPTDVTLFMFLMQHFGLQLQNNFVCGKVDERIVAVYKLANVRNRSEAWEDFRQFTQRYTPVVIIQFSESKEIQ